MESENDLERALFHLKSALQLLDDGGAPSEIATHVDLGFAMLTRLLTGTDEAP
jgi:hypothetical protein